MNICIDGKREALSALTGYAALHSIPGVTPLTVRLRQARLNHGLSQAELARRSGVNQGTISRIEAGETRGVALTTIDRLAKALGVSPKSLLASSQRLPRKRRPE